MLKPGQILFNEYEIIRPLGQGGFATVFEAHDKALGRRVAIKELLTNKSESQKAIKRFLQEARVAAALEHPNVVSIYALRNQGNHIYMIMEHLPSGTLQKLIQRQGKLPVEKAVQLTIGICEGLAKFHAKNIIHRDIKGENILLTADGRPKIIDFGIAHVPRSDDMKLTVDGFQPGTLIYNSPEQMRGEALDPRSDVYQIGQLLYTMLLGQHYIDLDALEKKILTESTTEKVRSQSKLAMIMFYKYELLEKIICEEMPDGLKILWQEIGSLAGVVEKALAKNREDRFKDASEFGATLKTLNLDTASAPSESETFVIHDSRAYNKRGLAHSNTRNYEQAIISYKQAIALDPSYAEAYNNISTAHLQMNNYGQAVLDCNQAIKLAPNFVAAYLNRAIAYAGLRRYKQALENYTIALKLSPNNIYAHYNQGNVYIWMGNPTAAINSFTKVIELNMRFVAAYVNRSIAHIEQGDYNQALDDLSQAITINPDYSYAYYNRANVYRELNRYQEAINDYSKVIELNPGHPHAYENRGDAYAALGNEEKATEDYTKIIDQISAINNPKRFSIASSMIMPTMPLSFLESED